MYSDSFMPSYVNSMLYGMDFDFLTLNSLMIILVERSTYFSGTAENKIVNGLAAGAMIAYMVDLTLIWVRSRYGRRNIARHTLVNDEKFLIT